MEEKQYFSWVIGYELLKEINLHNIVECDVLFDFSNNIANEFINSEEYKNPKYSSYDMFYKFIDNKGGMKKIFNDYMGIDDVEIIEDLI